MNEAAPSTTSDWRARARSEHYDLRPLIGGGRPEAMGSERLATPAPAAGIMSAEYVACDARDVAAAVSNARRAFESGAWSDLAPLQRKLALLRLADLVDRHAEALGLADTLDVGKPIGAAIMEAHIAAHFIRWFGEATDKWHDGATVPCGAGGFEAHVRRPRGVVAAIVPWNYPVINSPLKFAPALAAGNCVVLKPSELAPRSALRLAELALEAGLPPGVLNVVPGGAATGEALARSAGVDMIAFTGSTRTGRALLRAVGDSGLRPLQLECGGKSPEIVLADAAALDLEQVAAVILAGSLANSGQLCVARTRIIAHESIYERLAGHLIRQAEQVRCGDPLDPQTRFGPLASARQREAVLGYVESGIAEGARLELDGRDPPSPVEGAFVGPTIFSGAAASSRIAREEIFGPVLTLSRFGEVAEALAMANDSDYGLAATLWTRDIELAHRIGARLRVGKLKVMSTTQPTPGGGVAHESEPAGQSGFGVEGGIRGIETYTRLQALEFSFGSAAPR